MGEALFQPSILGLEAHGIVEQLVRSISTVSSENHRQLLENTVLCGGTTSMTGYVIFLSLFFCLFIFILLYTLNIAEIKMNYHYFFNVGHQSFAL